MTATARNTTCGERSGHPDGCEFQPNVQISPYASDGLRSRHSLPKRCWRRYCAQAVLPFGCSCGQPIVAGTPSWRAAMWPAAHRGWRAHLLMDCVHIRFRCRPALAAAFCKTCLGRTWAKPGPNLGLGRLSLALCTLYSRHEGINSPPLPTPPVV
jgi:hypothetical protein